MTKVRMRPACTMHAVQQEIDMDDYQDNEMLTNPLLEEEAKGEQPIVSGRRFLSPTGTASVWWESEMLSNDVTAIDMVNISDGDNSVGFYCDPEAIEHLVHELEVYLRERKKSKGTEEGVY